jgi:hypothetical protein
LQAYTLIKKSQKNLNLAPAWEDLYFVESLVIKHYKHKFLVIIDEFDDLDPAFYTGERGKQFVKTLRSLSEIGLTFFCAGSERMEAIYQRHQADLNKWTNIHLDRLENRIDCTSLIVKPVAESIELSRGNRFYY